MRKIKEILYSLYVLDSYKKDEEPTEFEFISLKSRSIGNFDSKIKNKKSLINMIKKILSNKLNMGDIQINKIIEFKIGDIIKTDIKTANYVLKFVFLKVNNKTQIEIYENQIKISIINI